VARTQLLSVDELGCVCIENHSMAYVWHALNAFSG
jgi:hypothetical protein